MEWKAIKTEKEYQTTIRRLGLIFDAKRNSKKGNELEMLSLLIENYEQENSPIDPPDPIEAKIFRTEQLGY